MDGRRHPLSAYGASRRGGGGGGRTHLAPDRVVSGRGSQTSHRERPSVEERRLSDARAGSPPRVRGRAIWDGWHGRRQAGGTARGCLTDADADADADGDSRRASSCPHHAPGPATHSRRRGGWRRADGAVDGAQSQCHDLSSACGRGFGGDANDVGVREVHPGTSSRSSTRGYISGQRAPPSS